MADSQGAAGPAEQTQHTKPAEDTMTSKEKGYVSPDTNKLGVSFRMTRARSIWCHKCLGGC